MTGFYIYIYILFGYVAIALLFVEHNNNIIKPNYLTGKICKSILKLKLIENSCLPAQGDLRLSCEPGSVFLAKMKNPFLNINSINCIHPIQLVKVQRHMLNIFDKYFNKSFFQHKYKCLSYSLTIYCNTAELHKPTGLQKQEHESV